MCQRRRPAGPGAAGGAGGADSGTAGGGLRSAGGPAPVQLRDRAQRGESGGSAGGVVL